MKTLSNLHQDYLAEIYQQSQIESNGSTNFVSSADLIDKLQVSQSTVNRMIDRLRDAALINHERYVGVQLTERGKQEALVVIRKQAIIESFLVRVMGFAWHEVYDEARRMRHHISATLLNRMLEMAGNPARSPFGEWLDGQSQDPRAELFLSDAEVGQSYRIARVLTRQRDRLEYLSALGLIPDTQFNLLHKAPFNGPIQIQLAREYRIIGHEMAKLLTVTALT